MVPAHGQCLTTSEPERGSVGHDQTRLPVGPGPGTLESLRLQGFNCCWSHSVDGASMYIMRQKRNHGIFIDANCRNTTPFLAEAGRFETPQIASFKVNCQATFDISYFEAVPIKEVVREACRAFIWEYEKDANRTFGEKAAVAAMKTLVFHSDDDLQVLQNGILRNIQILQALSGTLARMELSREALINASGTVQEQAGH